MNKNKSFTLVELLVVIAIVGILSTVAVGSISKARNRARIARNLEFSQTLFNGLGSHAVGIWSFDQVQAGVAPDISRSGNDGSLQGDTIQDSDTPYAIITSATGKHSLLFDGTGDYVECQDNDTLDPEEQPLTIELWFNWDGTLGMNTLFDKDGLYQARVFNNNLQYYLEPDGTWRGETSFPVAPDHWYHAVIVYDKAKQYLYQDGKLVYSRDQIGDIGENEARLLIGARSGAAANQYFNGKIDELRIYVSALSLAEIQKHYVQGLKMRSGNN